MYYGFFRVYEFFFVYCVLGVGCRVVGRVLFVGLLGG